MKNIDLMKLFYLCATMLILLNSGTGCTSKHRIYLLNIGNDVAFIKPTDGIRILKIDDTRLNIIPDGYMALGIGKPKYSSVSINPGHHKVVVDVEYFREGAVFFLDADFKKNTLYYVKFKVIKRVEGENAWVLDVWIEDSTNKHVVSKIVKNI
ncbi:hypothetical protein JCM14469_30700 [Desulfatiferula olefinivorans]